MNSKAVKQTLKVNHKLLSVYIQGNYPIPPPDRPQIGSSHSLGDLSIYVNLKSAVSGPPKVVGPGLLHLPKFDLYHRFDKWPYLLK
jgi:hypothetical protein